jgi:hypothetical protein
VAVSFIGGGNQSTQRKPPTCSKSLTNFITYFCIKYTSPRVGFKLTTLVVIGSCCICSCKFNYHTITTTTALPTSNLDIKYITVTCIKEGPISKLNIKVFNIDAHEILRFPSERKSDFSTSENRKKTFILLNKNVYFTV